MTHPEREIRAFYTPSIIRVYQAYSDVIADSALREQLRAKGLRHAASFTWDNTAAKTQAVLSRYAH